MKTVQNANGKWFFFIESLSFLSKIAFLEAAEYGAWKHA